MTLATITEELFDLAKRGMDCEQATTDGPRSIPEFMRTALLD